MRKFFVFIMLLTLLAACNPAPVAETVAPIEYSAAFTLGLEEGTNSANFPNRVTVTLLSVNDSRCPIDVECVWAGMVEVELELAELLHEPRTVKLYLGDTGDDQPTFLEIDSGYLTLLSVTPLPENAKEILPAEIEVELVITQLAIM